MNRRSDRVSLVLLLAAWIASLGTTALADDLRLARQVVPVSQSIELRIDADQPDYNGSVRIELEVREATPSFQLHAEGQTIDRLELRGPDGPVEAAREIGHEGLTTLTADSPLAVGSWTLEIDFTNQFNTKSVGLYRIDHQDRGYLFTQFEAVEARKAFPCWDEPGFKIPYRMTLQVPQDHVAVTNTPIESEAVEDGWKTLAFKKTKPLPTYLLAIASGPLDSVPITGLSVPGRIYTVSGQSHLTALAVEVTSPILAALEEYFGRAYPYEKLDFIAIPEYWPGAMENAGAVTYKDSLLLLDPKASSSRQKRSLASVTAHELAHMWFGDLVTMKWWDDLWLNESFATLVGQKITGQLYPEYRVELGDRRSVQGTMGRDARPSTKKIRKRIETTASIEEDLGLAYRKGQAVLGMVEQWLGEEVFHAGVLAYIEAHAWGNAEASDLWNALSKASERDVAGVLSSFLDQPGLPLVDVRIASDDTLVIRQERFVNRGIKARPQTWTIPVRVRFGDGETSETRTFLIDSEVERIRLERRVTWAYPDSGAHGYYRFSVPTPMLLDLAADAPARLSPSERIVFLGNAAALLDAGKLSGAEYLQVLGGFAADPEPDVLAAVLNGLGKVEGAFVPDELRGAFASYVQHTLRPVLDRIGIEKHNGEDEAVAQLRPRVVGWLGEEGQDTQVRRHARKLAQAYMQDSGSIDPELAGVALSVAAIEGDRELFEAYRKRFEEAETPVDRSRYLSALGAFENREIQDEALKFSLDGPIRPDEIFRIPRGIMTTDKSADHVFRWWLAHYDEITARLPAMMTAFAPFIAGGCSTERLERAREFFEDPDHQVDGTLNNLEKVADQVKDCADLRRREGPAVARYLKTLDSGQGTR